MEIVEIERRLETFLETIKAMEEFDRVEFIIFYGSLAQGKGMGGSDIDVCVYYRAREEDMSRFRLKLLSRLCSDVYDVQIFQQLPLYVKKEVLKGRAVYVRNRRFLDEVALKTIMDYDFFKPRFYDYIYR